MDTLFSPTAVHFDVYSGKCGTETVSHIQVLHLDLHIHLGM